MIYDNRHKKIKDDTTYITITHLGCRIYQITQGQCPYDTRVPKTKPECELVVIHGIHDIHKTQFQHNSSQEANYNSSKSLYFDCNHPG